MIWKEGRLKNGFERPVVIHRAILGSIERMSAILMEHFAGKWPFWLSPRQVQVVPVGTQFNEYALWVERQLQIHGSHAEAETSGKTLNKKVREAQLASWNYVAVFRAEEQNALSVNLRSRESEKPLGAFSMVDFIAKLDAEAMPSSQPLRQFEAFQGRLPAEPKKTEVPEPMPSAKLAPKPAFQKQGSLQLRKAASDKFATLSVDDDVRHSSRAILTSKALSPVLQMLSCSSSSQSRECPRRQTSSAGSITWAPFRAATVRSG